MSEFDFKLSVKPDAQPLKSSHEANNIEAELKGIFNDLFALTGKGTFDAGVLGAAHLGSFDLVRRSVNRDGLVLLSGDREEAATRYLYRAWQSGDIQKRGLHFVRTYLQLLFPGESEVSQLWHTKSGPYGTAFISKEARDPYWYRFIGEAGLKVDGSWRVGRPLSFDDISPPYYKPSQEDLFLTSRIEIRLGLEAIADSVNSAGSNTESSATTGLIQIIRSVIPARLIPEFKFWLRFILSVMIRSSSKLSMQKRSGLRYPWCGRVLTENNDAKWQLGRDGDLVKLALPMGSFKLGERRGGFAEWQLKGCRISSQVNAEIFAEPDVFATPKVGQAGLRLDSSWGVGKNQLNTIGALSMDKRINIGQEPALETTFHEKFEVHVPGKPERLGRYRSLSRWMRLDGQWSVGEVKNKLGGFKLGRAHIATDQSINAEIVGQADAYAKQAIKTLQKGSVKQLTLKRRRVDGAWTLGSEQRLGRFKLKGQRLRSRKMTDFNPLGSFKLSADEKSGLGYVDHGPVDSLPIDGSWKLGMRRSPPEFSILVTKT